MPPQTLTFVVPGDPLPKGSTRAFMVGGQPRIVSTTKGLKEWQNRVALAAPPGVRFHGPVSLVAQFVLNRPKSVRDPFHVKKPDLDKLTRSVFDALSAVLFEDDKQVTDLHASKSYCHDDELPHVMITVHGNTDAPIQGRRKAQPPKPGDPAPRADAS